jgi:hypothetical protein
MNSISAAGGRGQQQQQSFITETLLGRPMILKALQKDVKYSTYGSRRMSEIKICVT